MNSKPTAPMNETPRKNGLIQLEDPRTAANFNPEFYPRVNGTTSPAPDATGRNDRIKLEFASAYYALNCEHARLVTLRHQPLSAERGKNEKKILQEIERLLIARDELEDEYAPFGVIAEPVVKDGFTVNLNISFGNVDAFGRLRTDCYTLTTSFPVPLPEGINFDDLPIFIEGPGMYPPRPGAAPI